MMMQVILVNGLYIIIFFAGTDQIEICIRWWWRHPGGAWSGGWAEVVKPP